MPELSVILPCHNEAALIETTVRRIHDVLVDAGIDYELLILEDGSTDGTREIGERLSGTGGVRFHHSDQRLGRGRAVANGIRMAEGRVAGFIDADLQTPAAYIPECFKVITDGADAVETIRYFHAGTRFSYLGRMFVSICYRRLFQRLFPVGLEDTLAGCKFFNRARILPVLDKVRDTHWFWDTEIMVLAIKEGLLVREIPSVFVALDETERRSKTNVVSDSLSYLRDLYHLRRRIRREYGD